MTPSDLLYSSEEMTVVVGDHNISPSKNLKRFDVVRQFIPKTFKNVKMGDDIMLLKVKTRVLSCNEIFTRWHAHLITTYLHFQISRKVVLGGKVKTVKIPHQHYSVKSNTQCLVAGWGSTKQCEFVNDLLALNVTTVDIRDCKEAWKKYKENITRLPPNVICAGGYKQNSGVCLVRIYKRQAGFHNVLSV